MIADTNGIDCECNRLIHGPNGPIPKLSPLRARFIEIKDAEEFLKRNEKIIKNVRTE